MARPRPGPAGTRSVEAGGNLGAPPKPPCSASYIPRRPSTAASSTPASSASAAGSSAGPAAQALGHLVRVGADLVGAFVPGLAHRVQHRGPRGHALALLGREVGTGVEGHLLGGQEHVQRPPTLAGHRLARLHVDRVQVGPFLTVELDAHEALVHERGGVGVLEGLALHHVAPVACRVADRQEDRHVALARRRQRLGAPRVPVHGVVLVLEQVRRGLAGQAVGHGPRLDALVRRRGGEPAERDPGAQERRAGQGHQRQLQAAERQRRAAVVRRTACRRTAGPGSRRAVDAGVRAFQRPQDPRPQIGVAGGRRGRPIRAPPSRWWGRG